MSPGRPLGIWPIVPAASHFLAPPSVDIVRFWIWPAVQRFILRLKSLQILTDWEKHGLLQVLPLLRQHDFPGHGDTTIDALQALLGSKDPVVGLSNTNSSKLAKTKKTTMPTPPTASVIGTDSTSALKRDKKVCKCHLKKCANCRNCMKRHCICVTQQPLNPSNPKKNQNNSVDVKKEKVPKKKAATPAPTTAAAPVDSKPLATPLIAPPAPALPPSSAMSIPPWNTDEDEETLRQDVSSMWELSNDMNQSFFSGNELGINMSGTLELDDAFGIIDMVESSSLFSGYPRDDGIGATATPIKEEPIQTPSTSSAQHSFLFEAGHVSVTGLPDSYYDSEKDASMDMKDFVGGDMTPNDDGSVRHRASCHRCGNLRKKNVRCLGCPHIFCQKYVL